MARGYIFPIGKDSLDSIPVISENDFYDRLSELAVDYVVDLSIRSAKKVVQSKIEMLCRYGTEKQESFGVICITQDVKKNYFKERFEKVQALMKNMALDEFSNSDLYTLRMSIEDTYEDCVYTKENGLQTFDAWLRSTEEGLYFFGSNVILMH